MGYYTDYEIRVTPDIPDTFLGELEEVSGYSFFSEEGQNLLYADGSCKWYDHDDDMEKLSAMFPENHPGRTCNGSFNEKPSQTRNQS